MPDDRIPIRLNLRAANCPACGFELRVKLELATTPGQTRPTACPGCHVALVTWAEEAHYGPPEVLPLKPKGDAG